MQDKIIYLPGVDWKYPDLLRKFQVHRRHRRRLSNSASMVIGDLLVLIIQGRQLDLPFYALLT